MLYFLCLEDFLIISFSLFIFTYFPDIQTIAASSFRLFGSGVGVQGRKGTEGHPIERQAKNGENRIVFWGLLFQTVLPRPLPQKLARIKAAPFKVDPSGETLKWYTVVSCCIQRANVQVLIGDPTPGRSRPPPRSLLAEGRDFALCDA